MEHGHNATDRVSARQPHGIGHTLGQRVQVLRAVLVLHTLGITRGTTGVAQPHGRVFIDLGPFIFSRLAVNKSFVIYRIRQFGSPTFKALFGSYDDFTNRRNFTVQVFQQRQHVGIDDDDLIFRVVNDVFQVLLG